MYIPLWILIIAAVLIFFYSRKGKGDTPSNRELANEEMWEQAERNMANVLEKSPLLEGYLDDERNMVRAMERDMIRLRERYKHDPTKLREIAHDWMDYSDAIRNIKFAREMLDVDMSDNAYDAFDERTKESHLAVQEISKRIEETLGDESSSKLVNDKLKTRAKAADEVLSGKKKAKNK